MYRPILILSALAVTALAVGLSIASALARAPAGHAAALLAGLSAAVVLAVHLSPALLRSVPRLVLWPVWLLCLAGALYAHASFLAAAAREAAAAHLASSPAAAAVAQQRAQVEQALAAIKARPAAQIARQLSWTEDQSRAAALHIELAEARRADGLRDQLIVLSAGTAAAAASATADPVDGTLARLLGVSADAVTLSVSLLLALLLEVIGMLLWREVFIVKRRQDHAPDSSPIVAPTAAPQAQQLVQAGMHQILQVNVHHPAPAAAQHVHDDALPTAQSAAQTVQLIDSSAADDVARVRAAIERGECRLTVKSIGVFLRCGTTRAQAVRHALLSRYSDE